MEKQGATVILQKNLTHLQDMLEKFVDKINI